MKMLERVLKEVLCVVNELLICGTPQVIIVIVVPNRALTTVLLITCYLEAQLKFQKKNTDENSKRKIII